MSTLTIADLMNNQRALQDLHKGYWPPMTPESAENKLLYAVGEIGEVIAIFQKQGADAPTSEPTRTHLMEETADVMMYLYDMLLCYGITPEEFSDVYKRKHEFNMNRNYRSGKHFTDTLEEK